MITELLEFGALVGLLSLPLFFRVKRKKTSIKIPKNYNDTSQARYAINENGYLERINHDKNISSHVQ